jgi:hypothetical protein
MKQTANIGVSAFIILSMSGCTTTPTPPPPPSESCPALAPGDPYKDAWHYVNAENYFDPAAEWRGMSLEMHSRSLPVQCTDEKWYVVRADGSVDALWGAGSLGVGTYRYVVTYRKYGSPQRMAGAELLFQKEGPKGKQRVAGDATILAGVGYDAQIDFQVLRGKVASKSLQGLALAVDAKQVEGRIVFSQFGLGSRKGPATVLSGDSINRMRSDMDRFEDPNELENFVPYILRPVTAD